MCTAEAYLHYFPKQSPGKSHRVYSGNYRIGCATADAVYLCLMGGMVAECECATQQKMREITPVCNTGFSAIVIETYITLQITGWDAAIPEEYSRICCIDSHETHCEEIVSIVGNNDRTRHVTGQNYCGGVKRTSCIKYHDTLGSLRRIN